MNTKAIVPIVRNVSENTFFLLQNWENASQEDKKNQLRLIVQGVVLRHRAQGDNLQTSCVVVRTFFLRLI